MELPTDFLGYRPTVGELIVGLILAVVAVPIWHVIRKAWDYLLDQIAAQSNNFRAKRIIQLENQIKSLQEYNEHKALLHILKKLLGLIVVLGLSSPMVMFLLSIDMSRSLYQIKEVLHVPEQPVSESLDSFVQTTFMIGGIGVAIILFIIARRSFTLLTEIEDFTDPPESIKRLEERITALKAKGSAQKAA